MQSDIHAALHYPYSLQAAKDNRTKDEILAFTIT
jgi:hypothetical protein